MRTSELGGDIEEISRVQPGLVKLVMGDVGQFRYDLIDIPIARVNDDRSFGLDQRPIVARLVEPIPLYDVALDLIPAHLFAGIDELHCTSFDTDCEICFQEES